MDESVFYFLDIKLRESSSSRQVFTWTGLKNHRSHPRKVPHIQSGSDGGGGQGGVFTLRAASRCSQQVCGSAERALSPPQGCVCAAA